MSLVSSLNPTELGPVELCPVDVSKEWKESEYALYQYTPNSVTLEKKDTESRIVGSGFSLSLVGSSISPNREHMLREHVGLKMSQGTLYKSSGLVTNMDPAQFPPPSQSYISRLDAPSPDEEERQFILCFVYIGKQGLDLFRNELDSFCGSLSSLLQALPAERVSVAFSNSVLKNRIEKWYLENIAYLVRVLQMCQTELPILLHIAVDSPVVVTGEDQSKVKDIEQFLEACSLASLMQLNTTEENNTSTKNSSSPVQIQITGDKCNISSKESSKFCQNWAQVLMSQGAASPDPFFLRQAIENYKLKIIQDVNALKRLLRHAESDHHALYRCYVFLCACGNGNLLLQCAIQESRTLDTPETSAVLNALQIFSDKNKL